MNEKSKEAIPGSHLDGESNFERRLYNARNGLADDAKGGNLSARVKGELLHAGGANFDDDNTDLLDRLGDVPEKVGKIHLPELPPIEGLLPVASESSEDFDPLGEPSPIACGAPLTPEEDHGSEAYDPHAMSERGLSPEAMCRAWGRVVSRETQANVTLGRNWRPTFSVKSQLDGAATIATHLACLTGELERPPTMDEQTATVIESTNGFIEHADDLANRYVLRTGILEEPSAKVAEFHAILAYDWPLGYFPSHFESLTRGEQVRQIERDVVRQQAVVPAPPSPKAKAYRSVTLVLTPFSFLRGASQESREPLRKGGQTRRKCSGAGPKARQRDAAFGPSSHMPALATSPSSFPGWDTLSPLQAACVGFDLMPEDDRTGPRSMAALARVWKRSESAMRDAKRRGYARLRSAARAQGHDLDLILAEYRRRQALAEAYAA